MPRHIRFGKKPNKFNAKRTSYKNMVFDSSAEAARAAALDMLVQVGEILWWMPQPNIRIGPDTKLRADFLVVPLPGSPWVEDVKGTETREFKKKKGLWVKYGPCDLHILRHDGRRFKTEIVTPERSRPVSGTGELI